MHRMTELFGRLRAGRRPRGGARRAAGGARRDRQGASGGVPGAGGLPHRRGALRDQIISPARTVLLVLLAASALVFVIACSNVANLILARTVRREGELAIRAALGASTGALRRTLLAESLLLCGAGARRSASRIAQPMVAVLARYAARFSVRALDLTRRRQPALGRRRPGAGRGRRCWRSCRGCRRPTRRTGFGSRAAACASPAGRTARLRVFAVTQIAASFVLLAGAGMLLTTLLTLQAARDRLRHAQRARGERAGDLVTAGRRSRSAGSTARRMRRIAELPGVERVAVGSMVPVARRRAASARLPVLGRGLRKRRRRGRSARAVPHRCRRASSRRSASRSSPAATSPRPIATAPSRSSSSARASRSACSRAGRGQPPPDVDRSA